VVCGGIVGLERERSAKPAGLRTNILICVGSAILMDLSIRLGVSADGARVGDPARLAAQVVSGIGFLGAGTIVQARGVVVGLTTAATMWVVMAVGLTIGAGHWIEALGATVLVTLVLTVLGRAERWVHAMRRTISGSIHATHDLQYEELADIFAAYGISVLGRQMHDTRHDRTYELQLAGPAKQFDNVAAELLRRPDVLSVSFD
jgi:putative Mg2+ transporter-C (MgtC) family protein